MKPQSPTVAAERRAWNYWFEDGLPTLVGGFGCVLFGLSFVFDHSLFRLVLMGLYCVILLRGRAIVEWLKVRLTYPRTGYVTPPDPQDQLPPVPGPTALSLEADPAQLANAASEKQKQMKRMILLLAMVLAAVLGTMFIERPWIYAAAGIDLALVLWIMNGKDLRLSWLTIGGLPLIGLGMAIFPQEGLTPAHRLGYFALAGGLLVVAEGAVTLARYLWRNPMQSVAAE